MKSRESYFNFEYFLTFLLFLPSLFLFPPELLSFRKYFLMGIIAGAGITYLSRDKLYFLRKFAALLFSSLVIFWMIYLLSKSTLLYRDVMVICIEGILLLAVVFSFSACFQEYLNYIQLFSILLFLCASALTVAFSETLLFSSVGFISCLLLTGRAKFHKLFDSPDRSNNLLRIINAPFIITLLLAVITAWLLFTWLPLGKIKTWGFLTQEDLSGEEKAQLNDTNKKEPSLDSQLQGELTKLILNFDSTDEMYRALALVGDLLVKEEASALDINQAEQGLLSMLDKPVLALEEERKKEIAGLIKEYTDDKIVQNLDRIRKSAAKAIENNRIALLQRIPILSSINKIGYSDSLGGVRKNGRQFEKVINELPIPESARKELEGLGSQMKEWKLYQLYHKESGLFQEESGRLDESKKHDACALAQKINDMKTIAESASLDTGIENLGGVSPVKGSKLMESARRSLNLKREMLAEKEGNDLRKKLESSGFSGQQLRDLKDGLGAIRESNDPEKAAGAISSFLNAIRKENGSQIPEEAKDILGAKLNSLIKKTMLSLQERIKESSLPGSGEGLFEDLKKIGSGRNKGRIISDVAKIQRSIEVLFKQGKIAKEARDNLIAGIETAKKLLVIKSELQEMGISEKLPDKSVKLDYESRLSGLLQGSSVGDEQKELINKLMDKLSSAQTISEVEDLLGRIEEEVESSSQKWSKEDAAKIKELMQQAAQAKKEILQNSSLNNKQKDRINRLMAKLAAAKTVPQAEDALEAVNQEMEALSREENNIGIGEIKELMQQAAQAKKEILQNSSLNNEQKELINKLMDKLSSAQTISEVEDLLGRIEEEVESSSQKWSKEDAAKIKELMQQAADAKKMLILEKNSYDLRRKIEALKTALPQQATMLEKNLDKLRESKTNKELSKNVSELEELLEREQPGEGSSSDINKEIQETGGERPLDIYLLPNYIVLPLGSSSSLKSVAIYNNQFAREIAPELEWFSSNPSVVFVDNSGLVKAVGVGKANIAARYKGSLSKKCEVTVVNAIPALEFNDIKSELDSKLNQ